MTDIEPAGSTYEIVGPFQSSRVVVGGRMVPFLEAEPANGGKIYLTLDSRYCLQVSVADADRFIPWIADVIAVAMGYSCHPRGDMEPVRMPPFRRLLGIDSVTTEPAGEPDA